LKQEERTHEEESGESQGIRSANGILISAFWTRQPNGAVPVLAYATHGKGSPGQGDPRWGGGRLCRKGIKAQLYGIRQPILSNIKNLPDGIRTRKSERCKKKAVFLESLQATHARSRR